MELRVLQIPAALVITAIAASVSGGACVDPQGTFDDFAERDEKIVKPTEAPAVSTGVVEGCVVPVAGSAAEGTYLFALSAQLENTQPLMFRADVTFGADAAAPTISFTLTPLRTPYRSAADNESLALYEEIPPTLEIGGPFALDAEGKFSADLKKDLSVDGKANLFSPNALVATIKLGLSNQICEPAEGVAPTTICGAVTGMVTKPIPLELNEGENFYAMTKYDGVTIPPEIFYDCALSVADAPL